MFREKINLVKLTKVRNKNKLLFICLENVYSVRGSGFKT